MDEQLAAQDSVTGEDQKTKSIAFGRILQEARLRAGMSEEAVAMSTRIARQFIVALESGDFSKLPGQLFGRGFVQSIARTIGADEATLVAAYQECLRAPAMMPSKGATDSEGVHATPSKVAPRLKAKPVRTAPIPKPVVAAESKDSSQRVKRVSKWLIAVPTGAAIAGLVALFVIGRQTSNTPDPVVGAADQQGNVISDSVATDVVVNDDDVHQDPPAEVAAAAGVAPVEPVAVAPAPAPALPAPASAAPVPEAVAASEDLQTLELVVKVAVKVKLGVDGGVTEIQELKPDTYRYQFKERADLMTYDAASVDVAFNGRSLGSLGSKGRIRRLSFAAPHLAQSAVPTSRATPQ